MRYRSLEKGFLLIIAVILIAVIAIVGIIIDYMFIGATSGAVNVLQSDQAFYVATSGLEITKRDMIARKLSCAYINANYGNPIQLFQGHSSLSRISGEFTASCSAMPSGTLPSQINATTTSIPLSFALISALPNSGAIVIDSEIISYSGKSGNFLINAIRGTYNTAAVAHSAGAIVNSNAYALIVTGAVPTITNPGGMRKLRVNIFFGTSGGGVFNLPGGYTPALTVGSGTVNLRGSASIINNYCNGSPGCSLLSGGPVNATGSFATNNGTSCGGSHCVIGPDIVQNYSQLISSNFYSYFFGSKTIADFNPTTISDISSLGSTSNGAYLINGDVRINSSKTFFQTSTPSVLIITGNLRINSSVTLGNTSGPVLIIVLGEVDINGSAAITGFIYSDTLLELNGSATVNGAVAGKAADVATGSASIIFNSQLLKSLGFVGGATAVGVPEIF